ncbi:MAG: nuclear transport factor 2 family protein [Myxococcota bacterium]
MPTIEGPPPRSGSSGPEDSALNPHPNVSLAQEAWNAVSNGDTEALRKHFSPDVVWHATAMGTPWSGDHKGTDAILDFLARIGESVERFDVSLEDILVSEARFAYVMQIHAERGGRPLDVVYLLTAQVEGGVIREVWTTPLDPARLRAFWN